MAQLHLIIGPVGAGKSTFGQRLAGEHRAVRLTLDAWMAVLYGADPRPAEGVIEWYLERRDRCLAQIWSVAEDLIAVGTSVVLELGLIQRHERAELYGFVDQGAHTLTVYVVDAPREVRRARVERRNREQGATFAMVVPPHIFELASDRWEPPDDTERHDRDVRDVDAG